MANTQANVGTGKPNVDGAVWRAPLGTTLPTDAISTLDSDFECMGYISEDGWTNSNTASSEDLKVWGGDVVDSSQTEKPDIFNATFVEVLNKAVLKATYGDDNVEGDLETGLTVHANAKELPMSVWVCEKLINGCYSRTVIPRGKVTEVGDIEYKDDSLVGYPLTIKAFPGGWDSSTDTHREYIIKRSTS